MNGRSPLEGPLRVSVVAAFPVPQSWSKKKRQLALANQLFPTVKPDADNLLKQVDGLNEIVWRDDKQIVRAEIHKTYSDRPCLSIMVYPIS
jgi:Holliday junction resolvase RusA-like endonuclease